VVSGQSISTHFVLLGLCDGFLGEFTGGAAMTGLSRLFAAAITAALVSTPAASFAYSLQGKGCDRDGTECKVYCNNGNLAGSMYWNGSVWTDGVKWDKDRDAMAKKICAANGTACI
jgi:hypothetical protein